MLGLRTNTDTENASHLRARDQAAKNALGGSRIKENPSSRKGLASVNTGGKRRQALGEITNNGARSVQKSARESKRSVGAEVPEIESCTPRTLFTPVLSVDEVNFPSLASYRDSQERDVADPPLCATITSDEDALRLWDPLPFNHPQDVPFVDLDFDI